MIISFQVNMMSAQMLAAGITASSSVAVADLAPGDRDEMKMLEAKAAGEEERGFVRQGRNAV